MQNKEAVKELFGAVAAKIGDRPGGYIRIIKTGFRRSDASEMAMIELVDFNEVMLSAKDGSKSKRRRTRRSGGKKNVETAAAVAAPVVEEVVNDEEE